MRSLSRALIEHGRIITTVPKAKETAAVHREARDAGEEGQRDGRQNEGYPLPPSGAAAAADKASVAKLFKEIGPQFADREGGYTRILKRHERRLGDAGHTAFIEFLKAGEKKERAAAPAPIAPKVTPDAKTEE